MGEKTTIIQFAIFILLTFAIAPISIKTTTETFYISGNDVVFNEVTICNNFEDPVYINKTQVFFDGLDLTAEKDYQSVPISPTECKVFDALSITLPKELERGKYLYHIGAQGSVYTTILVDCNCGIFSCDKCEQKVHSPLNEVTEAREVVTTLLSQSELLLENRSSCRYHQPHV